MSNKVAIIGAGPAGLTSAKAALENGLEPTVLEAAETIGGLWRPDTGLVWQGMQTNLSKYTCCFSDLPWADDTPDFPSALAVYNYLATYSQHYQLSHHIQTGTAVKSIIPSDNGYKLTMQIGAKIRQKEFNHLVMANGIFNKPYQPDVKGEFDGETLHSAQYKDGEKYKNKRVVVIGGSFTGVEIAADLARNGAQIFFVFRKSLWILPKLVPRPNNSSVPLDLHFYQKNEGDNAIEKTDLHKQATRYFEDTFGNPYQSHKALRTYHDGKSPFVAISDDFLSHVKSKAILPIKGDLELLEPSGPVITGGRLAADAIIFCTGYEADLGLLDPVIQKTISYDQSDRFMPFLADDATTHPDLPDMGFVGLYRGPYFGVMELQARLLMMQFAGHIDHCKDPGSLKTAADIREESGQKQFPYGEYLNLCDRLATKIGVAEGAQKLDEPITPAHYRMTGPNAKPDIAKTIIAAANRRYNGPS